VARDLRRVITAVKYNFNLGEFDFSAVASVVLSIFQRGTPSTTRARNKVKQVTDLDQVKVSKITGRRSLYYPLPLLPSLDRS